MRQAMILSAALLALVASPARADVTSATAGAFVLESSADVPVAPERAWRALGEVGHWWNGAHTYSGDASRLRLDMRAGGCWCERWDSGSVEHGRVILVMEHEGERTLRVLAPLGPLQEMAVNAVLTFKVTPGTDGARIAMTYRVSGDPGLGLDRIAPLVDQVMMEQFGRLTRYAGTGNAAPP